MSPCFMSQERIPTPQSTLYFETFGLVCFLQKREGMEVPLSAPVNGGGPVCPWSVGLTDEAGASISGRPKSAGGLSQLDSALLGALV